MDGCVGSTWGQHEGSYAMEAPGPLAAHWGWRQLPLTQRHLGLGEWLGNVAGLCGSAVELLGLPAPQLALSARMSAKGAAA